ncbi:hypothetical protein DAAJ005_18315 (plasmid) [Deinococcus sp. AJ005]|nr:hypothetical protein DAAJ005_18315 [Deinococcus sp. AJ005]
MPSRSRNLRFSSCQTLTLKVRRLKEAQPLPKNKGIVENLKGVLELPQ